MSFVSGTGFLVSAGGDVLTNHHVAEEFGREGSVWLGDAALYRAASDASFPFLRLREAPPRAGEPVCLRMNPLARGARASVGTVLGSPRSVQGIPSVRYDAPSRWGASGSPVIDAHGEVVAVRGGWRDGVDFGVTADAVRTWLAR